MFRFVFMLIQSFKSFPGFVSSPFLDIYETGLNEPDERDGGASPICGSPFEGDEKIVEPATGVEDWPEPAGACIFPRGHRYLPSIFYICAC